MIKQAEESIQSSGRFDTDDDFTVIVQPFLEETHSAPTLVRKTLFLH